MDRYTYSDDAFAIVNEGIKLLRFKDKNGQVDAELLDFAISNLELVPVSEEERDVALSKLLFNKLALALNTQPDIDFIDQTRHLHFFESKMSPNFIENGPGTQDGKRLKATGKAVFAYNDKTMELSYLMQISGLESEELVGYLRLGNSADTAGEIIAELPLGKTKFATIELSKENVDKLFSGEVYVNIKSENWPHGIMRGQIFPSHLSSRSNSPFQVKEPKEDQADIMDILRRQKFADNKTDKIVRKGQSPVEEGQDPPVDVQQDTEPKTMERKEDEPQERGQEPSNVDPTTPEDVASIKGAGPVFEPQDTEPGGTPQEAPRGMDPKERPTLTQRPPRLDLPSSDREVEPEKEPEADVVTNDPPEPQMETQARVDLRKVDLSQVLDLRDLNVSDLLDLRKVNLSQIVDEEALARMTDEDIDTAKVSEIVDLRKLNFADLIDLQRIDPQDVFQVRDLDVSDVVQGSVRRLINRAVDSILNKMFNWKSKSNLEDPNNKVLKEELELLDTPEKRKDFGLPKEQPEPTADTDKIQTVHPPSDSPDSVEPNEEEAEEESKQDAQV